MLTYFFIPNPMSAEHIAETVDLDQQAAKCRELNDQLRTTFTGGQILLTRGVQSLDDSIKAEVLRAIQTFDDFNEGNDPYGTHEFGCVTVHGQRVWFKIDAYDTNLEYGSPDPTNPDVTTRVMTILLPEEY